MYPITMLLFNGFAEAWLAGHLKYCHARPCHLNHVCVAGSCTEEEQAAMMTSLRSATRNTGFERWLGATIMPQPDASTTGSVGQTGACSGPPAEGK